MNLLSVSSERQRTLSKVSARVLAGTAFIINTPIATRYLTEFVDWIESGALGAVVYGRPRLGKSKATAWVLSMARRLLGSNIPWKVISVRDDALRHREFFQHILRSVRHRYYRSGTSGDKRDRLTEWLVARAVRSPLNCVVLVFDEAQQLKEQHYQWLLNVGNEVQDAGGRLFCLFVGQPELLNVKDALIEAGQEQIVARYMIRTHDFTGLLSQQHVFACLEQYGKTVFPAQSNLLFQDHYIPSARNTDFRLEHLAPAAWAEFSRLWSQGGLHGSAIVPMHYMTAFLVALLKMLSIREGPQPFVPPSATDVSKAAAKSGYREAVASRQATDLCPPGVRNERRSRR